MVGFLLQWPTLVTLAMLPVLVTVYVRLARSEEHEVRAELGQACDNAARRTPAFFPFVQRRARAVAEGMVRA
jgi:Cu+-exporting ATPase